MIEWQSIWIVHRGTALSDMVSFLLFCQNFKTFLWKVSVKILWMIGVDEIKKSLYCRTLWVSLSKYMNSQSSVFLYCSTVSAEICMHVDDVPFIIKLIIHLFRGFAVLRHSVFILSLVKTKVMRKYFFSTLFLFPSTSPCNDVETCFQWVLNNECQTALSGLVNHTVGVI